MANNEIQINGVRFEEAYWRVVRQQMARLSVAGLNVSGPEDDALDHEFGFRVSKPHITPGNVPLKRGEAPNSSARDSDAPTLSLTTDNGAWIVSLRDYVPGPGPGDFTHEYDRLDEAVGNILQYYFGDPSRMQAKR